jgi:hypothetical protein
MQPAPRSLWAIASNSKQIPHPIEPTATRREGLQPLPPRLCKAQRVGEGQAWGVSGGPFDAIALGAFVSLLEEPQGNGIPRP